MRQFVILAAVLTGALCTRAPADTLRWVNAAGGSWTVAENWDLGRVPTSSDLARFDLPATYSVTVPASPGVSVNGIDVLAGSVTFTAAGTPQGLISLSLFGGSAHRLYVGDGVSPATLTLHNAAISTSSSPLEVRPQSTLATMAGGSYFSNNVLRVPAGATLRVDGGTVNPGQLLIQGGLAIVTAGTMTGEIVSLSAGSTVRATGPTARIGILDGLTLRGRVEVSQGAQVSPISFSGSTQVVAEGCEMLISDGGRATLPNFIGDAATSISTATGGQWTTECSCSTYRGPFIAGPATTTRLYGTYYDRLDLDQAGVHTLGTLAVFRGTLTTTIDGTTRPATPVVRSTAGPGTDIDLGGTFSVRVRNPNALHMGDIIPLIQHNRTTHNSFSQIIVPTLGGGRIMEVYSEGAPLTTYARIVQGPPSCFLNADFDGDGDVGTDADIEAFFRCLAGTCCATCASADFNGDGDTGTDADIEGFFTVLAGGAC